MRVEPKVYLIAESRQVEDAGNSTTPECYWWLKHLNGQRCLSFMSGSEPERIVEMAARRCYKSFDVGLNPNVNKIREDSESYHQNILSSGHGSVLEHSSATFAFEDVSRVFTHELVRHRAGAAYSQESLRYVRLSEGIDYFVPPEIDSHPELSDRFRVAMAELAKIQKELSDISNVGRQNFETKKKMTSAFRRVAPMGLATGIVATYNFRALRHVITMRTSRAAEYEIRMVFSQVARIAIKRWPMIFGDFSPVDTGDGPNVQEWVPKYEKV